MNYKVGIQVSKSVIGTRLVKYHILDSSLIVMCFNRLQNYHIVLKSHKNYLSFGYYK